MNTLDRHDGVLRFSYAAEDGRRVHGQHDPVEGVLALRVTGPGGRLLHEDNLPCDAADRLVSALAAWGEVPDALRDALPTLGGNAILLDTMLGNGAPGGAVRASVRRHGLKVAVVFLDRAGGRVAELRAGSLEALERKAGRALRLSRTTRRVLGGWLSGEPLWLGAVLVGWRLVNSRFGRVIRGAKDNERRMRALGYPVTRYKLAAFVIAGALAGLAGALLANATMFVGPQYLHWSRSGDLIVMVVLGGIGTLIGPVLGAAALLLLEEYVPELMNLAHAGLGEHWKIVLGPILLGLVLFARKGLWGVIAGSRAP